MCKDYDLRIRVERVEVRFQPSELRTAHLLARIGHIVERDKLHTLVLERELGWSKDLAKGITPIQPGIMLAGH